MTDVVGIGRLLIDFTPAGKRFNPLFEMNPGSAVANCLSACAALGAKTEFLGAVGADLFGDFLERCFWQKGIGTRGMVKRTDMHTALAFVSFEREAQPNYTFISDKTAYVLKKEEIDFSVVEDAKAVYFASICLTDAPSREAICAVVDCAKRAGTLVAMDVNYRAKQWKSEAEAKYWIDKTLHEADIIKMTETEALWVTGAAHYQQAAEMLLAYGARAVYLTMGSKGTHYRTHQEAGFCETFPVQAVDTTGCGDAFMGALLYFTLGNYPVKQCVCMANAVGAVCATHYGGFPSMPTMEELNAFLKGKT